MIVLILTALIILIAWEIGEYAQLYSETNYPNPFAGQTTERNCFGSNTTFDCYDQDEGTDFVDSPSPGDRLIFGWQDDNKP